MAEVVARLDRHGVQDLGVVAQFDDRHLVTKLAVDDPDHAAGLLRKAFEQTGYWPLLLLDDIAPSPPMDVAGALANGWRREDVVTGAAAVDLAAAITVAEAPYCGYFGGRPATAIPATPPDDMPPRPAEAAELGRGWTARQPALLLVPTRSPADSLAHIGFGRNNESPADAGHVRFHRYLREACGGVVTAVGTSRLNVSMPGRPLDPVAAFELADRIFEYCRDMETVLADFLAADPDEEDVVVLLAGIFAAGLTTLPLWWD